MNEKPLLEADDTVTILAPCGALAKERIIPPIKYLDGRGFKIIMSENLLARDRYLAGSIQQRVNDLHAAFSNPDVKAIFIARGGVGSTQLLPFLNFRLIAKNPKPFFGLSDSTAFQIALYQKAKIPSISGLALCSDFSSNGPNNFTKRNLEKLFKTSLFTSAKLKPHSKAHNIEGILIGGCLTLVVSLMGTPFQTKLKDKILFLEDIGEEPYRIDRMLTQISQQKDFNQLKAIVFGKFFKCEAENKAHGDVKAVIKKFAERIKVPVYSGLPYGHQPARLQIPIGIKARISKDNTLTINPFELYNINASN